MTQHPLIVPDLDLPGVPISLSAWLVNVGDLVVEGDRVAELLAGEVTFDLESPVTGIVVEKFVQLEEPLTVGQEIGTVVARKPKQNKPA